MLFKKILPFLLVGLVAVLVGCFNDSDLEPKVQTEQAEFRSDQPPRPTYEECDASLPKPCPDCKVRLISISDNSAQWSLNSYGAGGNEHKCCVNGSWKQNVSYGSGCGLGDNEEGVWHNLTCGLNPGAVFGLLFRSQRCNTNCPYTPNTAYVQIDCGNGVLTKYISANWDGDCSDQEVGTVTLSVGSDCGFD